MQKDIDSVSFLNQLGFIGLVGLSLVVTIAGLFIPVMEVDASQYALMSLELLKSNSVLKFTHLGVNYLDKPPLLFWLSSASIYVFGNTTLAYKLPSFIAAWASVYFLYKLTLIYYKINIYQLPHYCHLCTRHRRMAQHLSGWKVVQQAMVETGASK